MKRYELKLADGGRGVFKVSVVKDPAIESTLVHFSAEKEELHYFADQEKKVIYSVVMRPNKDIFRKNVNGEPANVFYTPETVELAQVNYFRNNGNAATNINHSELSDAEGIFPFESWIVTDAKTDRANKFGLDVMDGDWVMGLKVDNDELWNEHIKTGKLDGFSVEATNINYELKDGIAMTKEEKKPEDKNKTLWEQLDALFDNFKKQVKGNFAEETPEEEAVRLAAEAAAKEAAAAKAPETPEGDEDEEDKDEIIADLKAQIATLKADKVKAETDLVEMTTEKATADAALVTMTAEKEKVAADLLKMSKDTPAKKPIKDLPAPEAKKEYSEMSNAEKMRFNREKAKY